MTRTHRRFRRVLASFAMLTCATALAGSPEFIDLRNIEPLHGDANVGKTKATVCGACHGANGIAPAAMFPNLAGQRAEYLYWQLIEFQREARPESPMTSQVANLDEATLRDLAAYFASLPPAAPSQAAAATPADRGAALYRNGDPARGTPPCQGCHGADGGGNPLADTDTRYRAYPMLRGQHADYLIQRLKDFRDGKHELSSNDKIMTPVARTLDDDSMKAIAQWLEAGAH
ncbi:MAG: c-type cytochrome [Rhodanobacteraceae bacterium]